MNIIYFGTSNHSVILLNEILASKELKLSLVVTKGDKAVGRKKILTPSPVKAWCIKNNIPYITPVSLNKELPQVLEALKAHKTSLAVMADYGLIVPESIISFFEKGIVNIHFSLLPKLRGAAPVTYTLLHGETETGITYLLTSPRMDEGDILYQVPYKITELENDETLYSKLFTLASKHLEGVLKSYLEGKLTITKQDEGLATYTTPTGLLDRTTLVSKEDAKLNFGLGVKELERAIRAYFPWPTAWTTLGELASFLEFKPKHNPNLRVKIQSAHLNGEMLVFDKLQVEGGKSINFEEFSNGYLM